MELVPNCSKVTQSIHKKLEFVSQNNTKAAASIKNEYSTAKIAST